MISTTHFFVSDQSTFWRVSVHLWKTIGLCLCWLYKKNKSALFLLKAVFERERWGINRHVALFKTIQFGVTFRSHVITQYFKLRWKLNHLLNPFSPEINLFYLNSMLKICGIFSATSNSHTKVALQAKTFGIICIVFY